MGDVKTRGPDAKLCPSDGSIREQMQFSRKPALGVWLRCSAVRTDRASTPLARTRASMRRDGCIMTDNSFPVGNFILRQDGFTRNCISKAARGPEQVIIHFTKTIYIVTG